MQGPRDLAQGVRLCLLRSVTVDVGGDQVVARPSTSEAVRIDTAPSTSIFDVTECRMMWKRAGTVSNPARFNARA